MANGQPTKTDKESVLKADTSDASIKSGLVAVTEPKESRTSPPSGTTATTRNDSKKTSKNVDLQALRSKAGIVAGALADFQSAGGLVIVKNQEYTLPSGETYSAAKIYLVAENLLLTVNQTADGLDFSIVEK